METGPEDADFEAISRPTASGKVETEFPVSRSRENLAEAKRHQTRGSGEPKSEDGHGIGIGGGLTPQTGSMQEENIKWQIKVWNLCLSSIWLLFCIVS